VGEPLLHPSEHGLIGEDEIVARLLATGEYGRSFEQVSGGGGSITMQKVRRALAAYVRSLQTGTSQFDRFFVQGDKAALSPVQRQGFALFTGSAGCSGCHKIGSDARFTDDAFHSLGVGLERLQVNLTSVARRAFNLDDNTRFLAILEDVEIASLGRFVVTRQAADIGKFRTPSLRNVAVTAPYMHDGSVASLEEALDRELYYRGLARGEAVVLTQEERGAIIAFLHALTDAEYMTSMSDP
jgi:cytochrome c peroxidase